MRVKHNFLVMLYPLKLLIDGGEATHLRETRLS